METAKIRKVVQGEKFTFFVMTTLIGSILTVLFNYAAFIAQKNAEEAKEKNKFKNEMCKEILIGINFRSYYQQKIWNLKRHNEGYDQHSDKMAEAIEKWNINMPLWRAFLESNFGDRTAELLLSDRASKGEVSRDSIDCLHAAFLLIHKRVRDYDFGNKAQEEEITLLWKQAGEFQMKLSQKITEALSH